MNIISKNFLSCTCLSHPLSSLFINTNSIFECIKILNDIKNQLASKSVFVLWLNDGHQPNTMRDVNINGKSQIKESKRIELALSTSMLAEWKSMSDKLHLCTNSIYNVE